MPINQAFLGEFDHEKWPALVKISNASPMINTIGRRIPSP